MTSGISVGEDGRSTTLEEGLVSVVELVCERVAAAVVPPFAVGACDLFATCRDCDARDVAAAGSMTRRSDAMGVGPTLASDVTVNGLAGVAGVANKAAVGDGESTGTKDGGGVTDGVVDAGVDCAGACVASRGLIKCRGSTTINDPAATATTAMISPVDNTDDLRCCGAAAWRPIR